MYLNPLCYNLNPFLVTTINDLGNSLLLFSLKLIFGLVWCVSSVFFVCLFLNQVSALLS